jgi:hypothetical protein
MKKLSDRTTVILVTAAYVTFWSAANVGLKVALGPTWPWVDWGSWVVGYIGGAVVGAWVGWHQTSRQRAEVRDVLRQTLGRARRLDDLITHLKQPANPGSGNGDAGVEQAQPAGAVPHEHAEVVDGAEGGHGRVGRA